MTASLIVLGVCFVVAIFLIVVGIVRVVQIGLVLKARVARYGDLPVFAAARIAQVRVARAAASAAGVPTLLDRAAAAVDRLTFARASVGASLATAIGLVRSLPEIVFGR